VELLDIGLGIDAVGDAVAISNRGGAPLWAWHRRPTGPWVAQAPPRKVDGFIDLAVSRFGRALVVVGCDDVKASGAHLPGGSWRAAQTLQAGQVAGSLCGPHDPQINDAGDAVVTWGELQGNVANPVRASVLDGPATAETTSLTASGPRIAVGCRAPGGSW
jgi:hypothetical protein